METRLSSLAGPPAPSSVPIGRRPRPPAMPMSRSPPYAGREAAIRHDDRSSRNDAVCQIPPQLDEQSARHGDDADLSAARPAPREARLPPLRQRALRLIPHPHPRDLHGQAAYPTTSRLADAAV